MERSTWLQEKRRISEVRYDTLHASTYNEKWGYINQSHRAFLARLLALCPQHGTLLDAACGTGKYWPLILEGGYTVMGVDQSQQMLAQATGKFPQVRVEKLGLQEISFDAAFDGIMCMDAMEFVSPEDWPLVLTNFHRALKSNGHLYFTVELISTEAREHSHHESLKQGLPVVEGEYAHEGYYHYYPTLEQVRIWISQASFTLLDEGEGDDYQHFLVQRTQ